MKAIMISIKPKWVADILNGRKTIEIRKTMPKCDLPIDVYIYCTKDLKSGKKALSWLNEKALSKVKTITYLENDILGKVVAKFTLNKVEEIFMEDWEYQTDSLDEHNLRVKSRLTDPELHEYFKGNKGYAWYIDNLEIFDKPKELSEFKIYHEKKDEHSPCWTCKRFGTGCMSCSLTNAPENWCYVEEE